MRRRRGRVFQPTPGRGKSWAFVIDVHLPGEPRNQVKQGGFETMADAVAALDAVKADALAGRIPSSRDDLTLGAYLRDWLANMPLRGYRPATVSSYRRAVQTQVLSRPIASTRLQALSVQHFDKLYADLARCGRVDGGPLGARSILNTHTVLHRALDDAVKKRLLTQNPTHNATRPTAAAVRPKEVEPLNTDEVALVLHLLNDSPDRAMWRLFIVTGMRRSEVAGLRWIDVDWEHRRLLVRQVAMRIDKELYVGPAKTDRSARSVNLDPTTIAALREHRARQNEVRLALGPDYNDRGFVFTRANGEPILTLSNRFAALRRTLPVRHITLHGLRHTHASILAASGTSPHDIAERLGHSDPSFTQRRYVHSFQTHQEEIARDFAAAVDRPPRLDSSTDEGRPVTAL